MNNQRLLLDVKCVTRSYQRDGANMDVVKGIDLQVWERDAICILGASGAGKSTLLHILGTLDKPTLGKVLYEGVDLSRKSPSELAEFRGKTIGFVFQFHHLLPEFTALENVIMPCRIAKMSLKDSEYKGRQLLTRLGLEHRLDHYPSQMSGGEQQRVAIARALIRSPRLLLADEPTGNLDSANAQIIQDLFFQLKEEEGLTLIVVSHDRQFASRFPRRLELKDGMWV
ncbi:MAG: ABC transporter ATP-binding protein [Bdellovibrionaceae bacterium]|nr:ABC transporter ATP-binding protein [Pseudobdellovibrionaceae bacterium]